MHNPGSSHPQYQGLACHTNSRHVLLCNLSRYCLPPCHQDDPVRDFLYLEYLLYLLHTSSTFDVSYCIINQVISYWPSAELALTFSLRPSTMTYSYVNGPIRNIVLKRLSFGSKECTNELKLECANFLGQTS